MLKILFFLSFSLFLSSAALAEEQKVNIGVISPLSGGGIAVVGKAVVNGIELARKNQPELFKNINFYYEDDQFSGQKSVLAYQKLTKTNNCKIILGFGAILAEAIGPLAERDQIPLINFNFVAEPVKDKNYVVRSMNHTLQYMTKLSDYFKSNKINYFPIISSDSTFFESMISSFTKSLNSTGKIDRIAVYSPTELDFRTSILKLKQKETKYIGLFLLPNQLLAFAKQAQQFGLDANYFGTDLFETAANIDHKISFETSIYPDNQVTTSFREEYFNNYQNVAQLTFAASSYDMSILTAELLTKIKEFNSQEFLSALKNIKKRAGALGEFSYESDKTGGQFFEYPVIIKKINQQTGTTINF